MRSCPLNKIRAPTLLFALADRLWDRFQRTKNRRDLDWSIALFRILLDSSVRTHSDRVIVLGKLAGCRITRFEIYGSSEDLDIAIRLWREAVALCPENQQGRFALLEILARSLWSRFELRGNVEDLDDVIDLQRTAFRLVEDYPDRSDSLSDLAVSFLTRFRRKGSADDLDEAITLFYAILDLRAGPRYDRASTLNNLAGALKMRFSQRGNQGDLDDSIALQREVLVLRPEGHPDRPSTLSNLGGTLHTRFEHCGMVGDIDEAIELHRTALTLFPKEHPAQCSALNNLALPLVRRFKQSGNMGDLNEAVGLHRSAVALCPDGHLDRASFLNSLAVALKIRFINGGNIGDINDSIEIHQAALVQLPEGHAELPSLFISLGGALRARFERCGKVDDLNRAIAFHRAALALLPEEHASRPTCLNHLAIGLRTRFDESADKDDLDESIGLLRIASVLHPEGNPDRASYLNNLANSLRARFQHDGNIDDVNESIEIYRTALALVPDKHSDRPGFLSNLARALRMRFRESRNADDLNEAVELQRAALAHLPDGHSHRSGSLNSLASCLRVRFEHNENADDLNEAVELYRSALALRPNGHPERSISLYGLASALSAQFSQFGSESDAKESIQLFQAGLALLPPGHPARTEGMYNIATAFLNRFKRWGHAKDFNKCIQLLRRASSRNTSPAVTSLEAAHRWAVLARSRDHSSTLPAYRRSISLLQSALMVRPNLSTRHSLLTSKVRYQMLGVDAASYAIEKGDLASAIELLEQGRTFLWSQMRGFRTPLEHLSLVDNGLAERFARCCRRLESLVTSSALASTEPHSVGGVFESFSNNPIDRKLELLRRLSEEQKAMIDEIRRVSGFEDFLQAAPFTTLQRAASEGPIIVINFSSYRCDALIVLSRVDVPCVCVPLDENWYEDALVLVKDFLSVRYRHGVHSKEYDEVLRRVMKILWDRVVARITQKLKELGITEGSRVWWCPTSVMSWFPFHAAGPYEGVNGRNRYFLDDYISSYTPTLKSLISARPAAQAETEKFLFVGDTKLRSTMKELSNIRKRRRVGRCLLDDKAYPGSVIKALQKVQWVHFACHGSLNPETPFESSLALPGGKLTLLDIAKADLRNAEFAFLSACHTAEQSPNTAFDEAIHLAAAMQFCGFRSVVGTMWKLLDRDGPILADVVYMHLMEDIEEGEIRYKRAAGAVREAALHLRSQRDWSDDGREVDIMMERWVNLVHIGA